MLIRLIKINSNSSANNLGCYSCGKVSHISRFACYKNREMNSTNNCESSNSNTSNTTVADEQRQLQSLENRNFVPQSYATRRVPNNSNRTSSQDYFRGSELNKQQASKSTKLPFSF